MRYLFGLLLVAFGAASLAASLGYIPFESVNKIWLWWPLLFVFWGADLILKNFKFRFLVMVVITLVFGFLIYDVSFSREPYFGGLRSLGHGNRAVTSDILVKKESLAKEASLEVETGAIDFKIRSGAEGVASGALDSDFMTPDVSTVLKDQVQKIKIITTPEPGRKVFLGSFKNQLNLLLDKDLPFNIWVKSGASKLDFDLRDLVISGVKIESGASTINLSLGDLVQNGAKVSIGAGASTINVSVPKNVGVRIKTESGLTTKNFEGFRLEGDYSENDAYKTAEKKIDIEIKAGASTINVKQS